MAHRKERLKKDEVKLEMTPMIDVVFQLHIFFVVSMKQEDILSKLEVIRPGISDPTPDERPPEPFTIVIDNQGFIYRGVGISDKRLAETIERVSKYNKKMSVVIKCTADSPHHYLVRLLDICAENGLTTLAVFSIN